MKTLLPVVIVLAGCQQPPPTNKIEEIVYSGQVISAQFVPSELGQVPQTRIKTSHFDITVRGLRGGLMSKESVVRKYKDGSNYFCVEGRKDCWLVLKGTPNASK